MPVAAESIPTGHRLSVTLDEALVRAHRFAVRGGCRLGGSWAVDLARQGVTDAHVVPTSNAAGEIWAACLGEASPIAESIARVLAAVPSQHRDVLLCVHVEPSVPEVRARFDKAALALGYRRHPLVLECVGFAEIEHESGWLLLPYERIAADVLRCYPPERLALERGLHMDMTREAGRRSDAHLARYHFANGRLGQDARILDAACGLGYGSALLWRNAPARRVTGVDLSPWVVDYAAANFGADERGPRFRHDDVYDLSAFDDESFDGVVSFETIEHLLDPFPFLRHVRRVLVEGGQLIASVPYRWVIDGDTGPYHHDWYDAPKFLDLCGRFLSVEDLWVETTGGGLFFGEAPRGLRRCAVFGDAPDDPVEWLVLVARKRRLFNRSQKSWLLLAPGVPQLTTMAASLGHWGISPEQVGVVGTSTYWDDGFHAVMQATSESFGFDYGGNFPLTVSVAAVGDPLDYAPGHDPARSLAGERVAAAYPILESLQGLDVVMTARPTMAGDVALLSALRPRQVRLAADGIQNDAVVRDFGAARGFEANPLARFPSDEEIACPPWLESETRAIGRPRVVDASTTADLLTRVSALPQARNLASDILSRDVPFSAVVISQNFSRAGVTTVEAAWIFYFHQIRSLLRRGPGAVLFKAHSRDCPTKLDALCRALEADAARVRITVGAECHLPLEAFPALAARVPVLDVWGTSSSALLGVANWPGVQPCCVDADYLEPEIRRQALQFSRRHGLPLLTLRFDDGVLGDEDRARLRRRFVSPVDASAAEMARRLFDAERGRRSAEAESRRFARENQLLEQLLVMGGTNTWIWGTGASGRLLLQRLRGWGIEPKGFIDGSESATPRVIDDLFVHPAADAGDARSLGALVVIASMFSEDILRRIRADGDWHSTTVVLGA